MARFVFHTQMFILYHLRKKNTELYLMYTSAFEMHTFESKEYLTECNGGSHHAQTLAETTGTTWYPCSSRTPP